MSLDGTTYDYVKLSGDDGVGRSEIGCVVAGVKTVFDTFQIPGELMAANSAYSFEATAYTFTVTGPGGLSQNYTDMAHISQLGALYRYGGFGLDGTQVGAYLQVSSAAGSLAGTYDYTIPAGIGQGDVIDIIAAGCGSVNNRSGNPVFNTLHYGTGLDIPLTTTTLSATIGGGATTVSVPGYGTISAPSGSVLLPSSWLDGYDPSVVLTTGGHLVGAAFIVAGSLSLPGSLAHLVLYDSGPTVGPAEAFVATQESTTSTTYTDLTTTTDQVTVNIGPSGMALVFISTGLLNNSAGAQTYLSFAVSGANTQAASDSQCVSYQTATNGGTDARGVPFLLTGLAQGATTFKLKYRVSSSTGTFSNRRIAVIPL